ncbi:MAG TPA: histidine kinase [Actinomycetota bacterium]|nr:histidine kinase [Actinomycetota bacterium]
MKTRTAGRLAWTLAGLFVVLGGFGLWATVTALGWGEAVDDLFYLPVFLAFALTGALVASRQPENRVGWLFLVVGFMASVAFSSDAYVRYSIRVTPLPLMQWLAWLSAWMWVLFFVPLVVFLPLLFPDGRLPSRRWLWLAIPAGALAVIIATLFALDPGPITGYKAEIPNPVGVAAFEGLGRAVDQLFLIPVVLSLASLASLVLRFRRSAPDVRQQIKWFLFGVTMLAAWFVASVVAERFGGLPLRLDQALGALAFISLPIGAAIGILRYRLFDIDVVVNRAVLYAILAAVFTAVYVGVVVGLGALVGTRGNALLTAVATALIAVGFHPVRERARHLANRLVYGKRATPYELLSEFSQRVGETYSAEDVLPRIARLIGEGTGAARSTVWLRLGNELHSAASWPDAGEPLVVALEGDALPDVPSGRAFPVRHQGELLGALSVLPRAGEELTPTQESLLSDLAGQAGLVLRNVRLIEELRASRKRLVAAQDEERRRLERNIHDGAQQQLVALAVKLRLVETTAARDPEKAATMAGQVKAELQAALEDLRDLARGIYPPLLADKGLPAALEAQARKSALPVEVHPDGVGRYPPEAEAAVYFCVLEALQNAAKYAEASRIDVRLEAADGELRFKVADDGRGFDPATTPLGSGLRNMADRLEALGGSLQIGSAVGGGTTVGGRIPVRPVAAR